MKFIDEEGKILEGTPLSSGEEIICEELTDMIRVESYDYVSLRSAANITGKILRMYKITKRVVEPVSGVSEFEQADSVISPIQYEDVSVPDIPEAPAYDML